MIKCIQIPNGEGANTKRWEQVNQKTENPVNFHDSGSLEWDAQSTARQCILCSSWEGGHLFLGVTRSYLLMNKYDNKG